MGQEIVAPRLDAAAAPVDAGEAAIDPAAFGRLYDEYLPRIYDFVACRVEERSVAEEITAATFQRALEAGRDEGLEPGRLHEFLFRVAATAVVDHARRRRGAGARGLRAGDFDRDTDHRRAAEAETDELAARAFAAAIDRAALRRAVQQLPEAQRRIVVLRYLDDLSIDEQCAVLAWTRESLARRLNGALRALDAALGEAAGNAA